MNFALNTKDFNQIIIKTAIFAAASFSICILGNFKIALANTIQSNAKLTEVKHFSAPLNFNDSMFFGPITKNEGAKQKSGQYFLTVEANDHSVIGIQCLIEGKNVDWKCSCLCISSVIGSDQHCAVYRDQIIQYYRSRF